MLRFAKTIAAIKTFALVAFLLTGAHSHVRSVAPSVSARQVTGYLFVSPNTDEGLLLQEATTRLGSERQQHAHWVAADILQQLGSQWHETSDALGDWSDGVENSLLVRLGQPTDGTAVRYAVASFGLRYEQKSVLGFTAAADGLHVVAEIDAPEVDLGRLRLELDRHGIKFRSLVPRPNGYRVIVFDEREGLRTNLQRFAAGYGVSVSRVRGTGEYLGADSRDKAQKCFRQIIRATENTWQPKFRPLVALTALTTS